MNFFMKFFMAMLFSQNNDILLQNFMKYIFFSIRRLHASVP